MFAGLLSFFGMGTSESNAWDIPVKNFGQVVEGKIYRSAAPSVSALQVARKEINLKTVLDLRDGWSLPEWRKYQYLLQTRLDIKAYNVAFDDKEYPRDVDVDMAMAILIDPKNWPILVHCAGGRHRTGGIIAEFRKVYQGWTPEKAYEEAKQYDWYTFRHKPWKEFILEPVEED